MSDQITQVDGAAADSMSDRRLARALELASDNATKRSDLVMDPGAADAFDGIVASNAVRLRNRSNDIAVDNRSTVISAAYVEQAAGELRIAQPAADGTVSLTIGAAMTPSSLTALATLPATAPAWLPLGLVALAIIGAVLIGVGITTNRRNR